MIHLDPRIGSGELLPHFRAYDVDIEDKINLPFGDMSFWGEGVGGSVMVGVERKIITDLIASMRSNRLSGFQLPGLLEMYDYVYLVVEGLWQCGKDGSIEVPVQGGWMALRVGSRSVLYREVDHYLASLEHRCGVTVVRTANKGQTAAFVVSRYLWWQKAWEKHDSMQAVYAPVEELAASRRGSFAPKRAGPVACVAAQFPGVSKKAFEFEKAFKNVHEMVNAEEKVLAAVEGMGKVGAKKIWKWLRGER